MALPVVSITFLVVAVGLVIHTLKRRSPKHYNFPPGPIPLPLIGNLHQVPKTHPWLKYTEWAKQYGDIVYFKAAGRNVFVLNSPEVVHELLEKRSNIYSDRPVLPLGGEIMGWGRGTALAQHEARHKTSRKLLAQTMGKSQSRRFWSLQEWQTARFLQRLEETPDELINHIRWTAGAIILRISHGYDVKWQNDPFVELAEQALDVFSTSTQPGRFLVDIFPFLQYVPDWFPGTAWKEFAKKGIKLREALYSVPYEWTVSQMREGHAIPSFVSEHLSDVSPGDIETEEVVRNVGVSLYGGGADTTVSAVASFFLLMALYPDIQAKAQEEIDLVVGRDRLPKGADRVNLKYVDCVMREVMRLNPVAPLAIPHRLRVDDNFRGYTLPKDSVVYANSWKILHDESLYPEPFVFKPERYMVPLSDPLAEKERDPLTYAFGYGRRVCPGLHLAEASVFLSIAMTLSAYDIRKKRDTGGNFIELKLDYITGTISHPAPFQVDIIPRSTETSKLIHRTAEAGIRD